MMRTGTACGRPRYSTAPTRGVRALQSDRFRQMPRKRLEITAQERSLGAEPPALIGDIGATNARFALLENGAQRAVEILPVASHASLEAAIRAYLAKAAPTIAPRLGALAVAGPVTGDFLSFTNHLWSFSVQALTEVLGFDRLEVVNDFVAAALCVPRLSPADRRQVGPGAPAAGAAIGIIGPGSGLG